MEKGSTEHPCFRKYVFAKYTLHANVDASSKPSSQKFQVAISKLGEQDSQTYIGVWVKTDCLECKCRDFKARLCIRTTLATNKYMNSANGKGRICKSQTHEKVIETFAFLAEFTPDILKITRELEAESKLVYVSNLEFYQGLTSVESILSYLRRCGAKQVLCRNYSDLKEQSSELDAVIDNLPEVRS